MDHEDAVGKICGDRSLVYMVAQFKPAFERFDGILLKQKIGVVLPGWLGATDVDHAVNQMNLDVLFFEANAEHAGDKPMGIFFNVNRDIVLGATGTILGSAMMAAFGVAVVATVFTMMHSLLFLIVTVH